MGLRALMAGEGGDVMEGRVIMQCQDHKDYKGIKYPTSGCEACKAVYLFELGRRMDQLSKRVDSVVERLTEAFDSLDPAAR